MVEVRKDDVIIKGYIRESRDLDFEERYGFDDSIDYEAERQRYNHMVKANNQDGCKAFMKSHGGSIAFAGKHAYYIELMKGGLLAQLNPSI